MCKKAVSQRRKLVWVIADVFGYEKQMLGHLLFVLSQTVPVFCLALIHQVVSGIIALIRGL